MRALLTAAIWLAVATAALADEPVAPVAPAAEITALVPEQAAEAAPAKSPEQEARLVATEFVSRLKPRLKQALNQGGPTRAIEVCASVAPGLADALSAETGWRVKRVSLKSRNASRAIPDPWEQAVLLEFNRRQLAGEAPEHIFFGEMSGGQYRYMQAQGVESMCLLCHGKGLADDVQKSLQQYYPDDWATGYSLGEVRGAISVSREM